jgi:hypothetical protein
LRLELGQALEQELHQTGLSRSRSRVVMRVHWVERVWPHDQLSKFQQLVLASSQLSKTRRWNANHIHDPY